MVNNKKISKDKDIDSIENLNKDLADKKALLIETKLSHRQGELTNTGALIKLRKQIARLKTQLRLAQLADKENK